jgi:hypothetical protein
MLQQPSELRLAKNVEIQQATLYADEARSPLPKADVDAAIFPRLSTLRHVELCGFSPV